MKDNNSLDLDAILHQDMNESTLELILDLVAQVSWWVHPSVYHAISIVYPKTRRKKGKEDRGQIINGIRLWFNEPASHALWLALGTNKDKIKNSYVCHIYENSVNDPDHFTNLANMTAFPKSLQSLSEWKPIADVLKYHSYKIYGYRGPEDVIPIPPKYYPESWQNTNNSSQEIEKIIQTLKDQSITRPSFNSKDKKLENTRITL